MVVYVFNFQIFTSLALFNILISPLNAFPWVINGLVEAWVSTKRVNAFLQLEELSLTEYYCQGIESSGSGDRLCSGGAVNVSELSYRYCSPTALVSGPATSCAVSIHRGSFTWTREEDKSSPDTGFLHPASTTSAGGDEDVRPHIASAVGEDSGHPHSKNMASARVGEDSGHPRSKNMASAGGIEHGQDTIEHGQDTIKHDQDTIEHQDTKIPWGLTDINITIKPVSSTLAVDLF